MAEIHDNTAWSRDISTPEARGSGANQDTAAATQSRKKQIAGYRATAYSGSKYRPNDKAKELIGVQDAVLFWASESGVDNSTDDAGNSGLHKSTFDTTTRADAAHVKLLNDSGSTQYVVAMAIKAKPVGRASGEDGWIHDDFVDYQDIFLNGENTFEFGNNFVVTKAQIENLADYYAKALGTVAGDSSSSRAKHIYSVTIPGRCWWFEPGEWYTLQVGGAGQREYIDSVCECYAVRVEAAADGLGTTSVDFREVEQNWVKDSNAVARFLATGDPKWKPNNFGRVVVAARDYLGVADYYCDGTADQTEIQAAIDYISKAFGGGLVELTEGQYNIAAAIDISYNNMFLAGKGKKTILDKNCNDYAIKAIGTDSVRINEICIRDLTIQRNSADTNQKALLYLEYCDQAKIQTATFKGNYNYTTFNSFITNGYGIYCKDTFQTEIANCVFKNIENRGIYLDHSPYEVDTIRSGSAIIQCSFYECYLGIQEESPDVSVVNNSFKNCQYAIWADARHCIFSGNVFNGIIPGEYLEDGGIPYPSFFIGDGADYARVADNKAIDCGNILEHALCETTSPIHIAADDGSLSGCTVARSTEQKHGGSYSHKMILDSTSTGEYRFCDNITKTDLHGLFPGTQYALSAYTYLLSTGSPTTAEVKLILGYTTTALGAWHETTGNVSTGKDAWGLAATTNFLIPSGAVGAKALIRINVAASTDEYFYIDNAKLTPIGSHNLHSQSFYNLGENTHLGV